MAPELIGGLGVVLLIILIALRMWIGVAMGIVGFLGLILLRNLNLALVSAAEVPFAQINNYTLTVVPMFALMGMIIAESRIGKDLFKACNVWMGHTKGGLAYATMMASAGIGAISGSHMVSTVIMSKIALPEMKRFKYDDGFSAACVVSAAPLSIILPPSLPLIVYGIITEQPIGHLFIAGIMPGILFFGALNAVIFVLMKKHPEYGPRGEKSTFKQKIRSSVSVLPIAMLFILVFGGIYSGIFTTTESGAIGSAGAIVISLAYKTLNGKNFMLALKETATTLGMVFSLLLGTYIFIRFITLSQLPFFITGFIIGLDASMPVMMLALAAIYIFMAMFLPEIPLIILTVPILFPALMAVGFDPIWYGIFMVLIMSLGSFTPPVGMLVFILSGLSGVPVPKLFKACVPFISVDLFMILMISIFPSIVTWLPSRMAG
ncbi:MAG: TRAP transporter large permease [Oscillospiraceae bacterium]|nr:TRAP transporter large permease [Oscillospiraceae bacterium]